MLNSTDETTRRLMIPAIIALVAGFARFAFSEQRSFWSFIRGVVIAGFVGLITTMALQNLDLQDGIKGSIVGITSFCAPEVAQFLIAAAGEVKKDPLKYVARVINAFRGGSQP